MNVTVVKNSVLEYALEEMIGKTYVLKKNNYLNSNLGK